MYGLYVSANHMLTININPCPHPVQYRVKDKHRFGCLTTGPCMYVR